jgi:hypothetical protein
MNRSPNSGVGTTPLQAIAWAQFIKPSTPPFETFREREVCDGGSEVRMAVAVRVGHNPDALASVLGSKGCSRYAVPFRIVPEGGQVPENSAKPSSPLASKQVCDVLHEDVARSKFASQAGDLAPKTRAFALQTRAKSGNRQVLAGEPAADDIDGNSSLGKSVAGEGSHVIEARNLGPMLRQHLAGEWVDLAEGDRLEPARALKAEREAADPAEQVEDAEHLRRPCRKVICDGVAQRGRGTRRLRGYHRLYDSPTSPGGAVGVAYIAGNGVACRSVAETATAEEVCAGHARMAAGTDRAAEEVCQRQPDRRGRVASNPCADTAAGDLRGVREGLRQRRGHRVQAFRAVAPVGHQAAFAVVFSRMPISRSVSAAMGAVFTPSSR